MSRKPIAISYDAEKSSEQVLDEFFMGVYTSFTETISRKQVTDYEQLNAILQNTVRQNISKNKSKDKSKNVFRTVPHKKDLLKLYQGLVKAGKIPSNYIVETILTSKVVRSSSGVLPISIALDGRNFSCAYNCAYCPNESRENGAAQDMARSYLSSEGTFVRGAIQDFNIVEQIWRRLAELEVMGHTPDKCEMIALGGTFDCYPQEYRWHFSLSVFYACNMYRYISLLFNGEHRQHLQTWISTNPFVNNTGLSKELTSFLYNIRPMPSLEDKNKTEVYEILREEQAINTKGQCCRVIGIVLETRPDRINRFTMLEMRAEGCTRVQLGIQTTDNAVLDYINRGHTVETSILANGMLRDCCFKVDGHIMPDLPGTTLEIDYEMVRKVFLGYDLQLDYTKVYPCLDLPYTQIRKWKESGEWQAIAETRFPEFIDFMCYTLSIIPPWTRVNRVQRDFPEATSNNNYLGYVSDNIKTNLQQIVTNEMAKRGLQSYDIRSREVGTSIVDSQLGDAKLYIRTYRANEGTEFFISVEIPKMAKEKTPNHFDNTNLLGLCRLRIPDFEFSDKSNIPYHYLPVYRTRSDRISRIRELHVYGNIASKSKDANSQHRGIGKFLIGVAENISRMYGCNISTIISGVGVRDYYEHLGYSLDSREDQFMVKNLDCDSELPMTLFGKKYNYECIQNVLMNSTISKTYTPITFENSVCTNKDTQVEKHTYNEIQNGEAQGFSFRVVEVVDTKQPEKLDLFETICVLVVGFVIMISYMKCILQILNF
jgi:ELP3 family radical SAM enzyme/protein acetyltransferase